ncbi:putative amino acid ABC transporter substrate-binding protein [Rickettsiales endosymbiont of Paramecium tredecaurelia]|uniref:ABC transporter substrate-binding protein n=1 Tax=Candidatus Sarmatiella mevalonica TaxID=2770581 RepID=UPI001920D703|nr:ABC transporter substrate-binding protein [Candidatus Sarmatiella mevalonica]MBL3284420.1 putative amino acid ABC transporter substrate-binding protein [Candidatus Sarmatiella mevalonica]
MALQLHSLGSHLRQFISALPLIFALLLCCGCEKEKSDVLKVVTSADYPPFEYYENDQIVGFDADLAKLIAQELGVDLAIASMQFSNILMAIQNGSADVAISSISATPQRSKNFDFSDSYYIQDLVLVYNKTLQPTSIDDFKNYVVGAQIGSAMEQWLSKHEDVRVSLFDNNNQAIEALKAGYINALLLDQPQAQAFCAVNTGLTYMKVDDGAGYRIALAKNSPLTAKINQIIKNLQASGEIEKLKAKWLNAQQENSNKQ